jgi:hypothetical protein
MVERNEHVAVADRQIAGQGLLQISSGQWSVVSGQWSVVSGQ